MKNKSSQAMLRIAVIVLAAVFAFGCSMGGSRGGSGGKTGGGGSNTPKADTATYEGVAGGSTYKLTITEKLTASVNPRYTPKGGDTYVLIITEGTNPGTSSGIVISPGSVLTLKPSNGDEFTVTVSGKDITKITGTITLEGGDKHTVPGDGTVTPKPPEGGGGIGATEYLSFTNVQLYKTDNIAGPMTGILTASTSIGNSTKYDGDYSELHNQYFKNSTVKITNGKLTINIGAPKELFPVTDYWFLGMGDFVSDKSAKIYGFEGTDFNDYNSWTTFQSQSGDKVVQFIYSDRAVTLNGSLGDRGLTITINNVNLAAGWNTLLFSYAGSGKITITKAAPPDYSNMRWVVYEYDDDYSIDKTPGTIYGLSYSEKCVLANGTTTVYLLTQSFSEAKNILTNRFGATMGSCSLWWSDPWGRDAVIFEETLWDYRLVYELTYDNWDDPDYSWCWLKN